MRLRLYLIAALAGAVLSGAVGTGVWAYGKAQYRAGVAAEAERHALALAKASAAAEQTARQEEARRVAVIEEIQRNAQTAIDQAQRDAAAATDVADRMRAQLTRLRAGHAPQGPVATLRGPTGPDALDLLTELFSWADGRSGELAAIADRARAAGLACERSYDAMRDSQ